MLCLDNQLFLAVSRTYYQNLYPGFWLCKPERSSFWNCR